MEEEEVIFEIERWTGHRWQPEMQAILISERGPLHSFRSNKRAFLSDETIRIKRLILTPDEECCILHELPAGQDFYFFSSLHQQNPRSLEGVPIAIQEPLTASKVREIRDRLWRQAMAVPMPLSVPPYRAMINGHPVTSHFGMMACDGLITCCTFPYGVQSPPSCRACGQTSDHYFTSQRDQSSLCATCFEGRETKGLAKEVKKTKHPLDAWMEG